MIVLYVIGGYCLVCYLVAAGFVFMAELNGSGNLGSVVLLLFAPITVPWYLFNALKGWLSR